MRVHLHHEQNGLMSRSEIGRRLFVMGLTERPLNAKEVYGIEQRALRKLKVALTDKGFRT